jgi:hypothetical protein
MIAAAHVLELAMISNPARRFGVVRPEGSRFPSPFNRSGFSTGQF